MITIPFAYDIIRKEKLSINYVNKYPTAYKSCNFLRCVECGDKITYRHGEKMVPFFAHDANGDGHEFCPLYTPGSATKSISKIRSKFYKSLNLEIFYFITIVDNVMRYYIMLPKLRYDEINRYQKDKLSIHIYSNNKILKISINNQSYPFNQYKYIELPDKPDIVYFNFFENGINKSKMAFSCSDRTSLFVYEKTDNAIILRKCVDKITLGQEYAFFSYKKYSEKELKYNKFTLLYSYSHYFIYSVKFEEVTFKEYNIAIKRNTFLSLKNDFFDYSNDFNVINSLIFKKKIINKTIHKPIVFEIPDEIKQYIDYIIMVDNHQAKTKGFGIIKKIKVQKDNQYSISVNFFKDENLFPCDKDTSFIFDTTGKLYKLMPPSYIDKIKKMKPFIKSYDELIPNISQIDDAYFRQWFSYKGYINEFKELIINLIINRKPIISGKNTVRALAQIISGLFGGKYYNCNLSEKYDIDLLSIEDNETIIISNFFSSKRSLEDFLKLDNLNRNSIKLFTISKSGLEMNESLIREKFIFFENFLQPLENYKSIENALYVNWEKIKFFNNIKFIKKYNFLELKKINLKLKCLVAAFIYRPTIKKMYLDDSQSLAWVKDVNEIKIKEFIKNFIKGKKV